ncbi:MAG TPA: hypothetical protein RMH99_01560 [Sandaracinaceae bacterium LLY-WYZ-13_1]|nr:hypothetical protein [Sandaracinaceae bacterium LLY-WYZ-13_1]
MKRTTLGFAAALLALGGCHYHEYDHGWRDCDDDRHGEVPCLGGECAPRDDGGMEDGSRAPDAGGAIGCGADADCGAGHACDDGSCALLPPGRCRRDGDCAAEEVCVEGACAPLEDACRFDHDCGLGRSCVDNACRERCADDAACPSGTACTDGRCLPTRECGPVTPCDGGERCVSERCLAACTDDGACGPDERCAADGVCRPDARPRPFCASDGDCAPGHVCRHGVCRTPCPTGTDEECQRWDSQLVRCGAASDGERLCYSRHETNPECARRADCEDGARCIDAICHP